MSGRPEVIQDWESIRSALGYEKVHLVGVSYGTFVGAAYAAKFPDRVGHFILDAVLPHGMPFQDMVTDQVAAINRLLLRADAFCLEDTACPFHGQGKGSVVKAWGRFSPVLFNSRSLRASAVPTPSATPLSRPRTFDWVLSVLLRSNPDFPKFNKALNDSLNGDASPFRICPYGDIRDTVVVPLLCSDLSKITRFVSSLRVAEMSLGREHRTNLSPGFKALSANSNSSDPAQMVYSQIWQFTYMCSAWPFDAPAPAPLPTQLPIMWVTSDFDLNLPTELSTFAFEQAPNSTLVIRHGDDHVSIELPATAAHSLEIDFIRTGGKRGALADPYKVAVGAIAGDMSAIETVQDFAPLPSPSKAVKLSGTLWPTMLTFIGLLVCL
ncbi:hypothetical protein B0H14DRAFT_3777173 [Mycena olivaceomarginata]|nr:hypothetical protein B0H14DRAFT_3777173 [Mycena olivaceomarginata]